ncbi:uncharacterized protein LY79DRAFT_571675 [Colletotrichum navitas]|uniref:Uncharacterized protein n=1 Tax=Colletotrichum navitas TaxID=681940 RepID=A0AAD8PL89_9PEZI|nr:uncharacterized protein LY79DRAFT_571675 [Colletotrichum navitas]KAK1569545.1 hypothetical protein LY79DRAFT_571675 [Colletotrichum navitas]
MQRPGANSTSHQLTSRSLRSQAARPAPDNPSSESRNIITSTLHVAVVSASQAISQSDTVLAAHWDNIRTAFIASGITTPFADWITQAFGNHNLLTIVRAAFATRWRQVEDSGSREVSRRRSAAKRLGLDGIWELYLWFGASVQSQRCWRLLPAGLEISARQFFVELCRVRAQQPLGKQKHHLEKPFGPREFELACCALTDRVTIRELETRDDQDKQDNRNQRRVVRQHRVEEDRQFEMQQAEQGQERPGEQRETSKTGRCQDKTQHDDSGYFEDSLDSESEERDNEQDDPGSFGVSDNIGMGSQVSSGASNVTESPQEPPTDMNDAQMNEIAQRLSVAKSKLAEVQDDCAAKKSQWEEVANSGTSAMHKYKMQIDARVSSIMEEDVEDPDKGSSEDESARGLGDLERDLKAAVSRKRKASRQIESLTTKSQRLMESEETMLALFKKAVEEHLGRMQQEQETIVGPGADQ